MLFRLKKINDIEKGVNELFKIPNSFYLEYSLLVKVLILRLFHIKNES